MAIPDRYDKGGAADAARLGTKSLEAWIAENEPGRVDLSGADLSNCNLRWMNFAGANLANVDFSDTDLTGAYFGPSTFSTERPHVSWQNVPALLTGANFSKSCLLAATFNYAKLSSARFDDALLGLATFRCVYFRNNNFFRAKLVNTGFLSCDLDGIVNLETIEHHGPSFLDVDTMMRSKILTREMLARFGTALSASQTLEIEALEGLRRSYASCFISHSTVDIAFCNLLYERMRAADLRVWYAPEDMRGGRKIAPQLSEAIEMHEKIILVLSESSMGSNWVINEIKWAIRSGAARENLFPICIVPYKSFLQWQLIDPENGANLADEIRRYFVLDFSEWKNVGAFEKSFQKLLRDLKSDVSTTS